MVEIALGELEMVRSFVLARVQNAADADDLVQEIALKALPRLAEGSSVEMIRGYLFATARSVLAAFWSSRLSHPEHELNDDVWIIRRSPATGTAAAERLDPVLSRLPAHYREVLELRYLKGYSLREAAGEMGRTLGGVKLMQLRALRAAARVALS